MVKPECFYARFDEEWKVLERHNGIEYESTVQSERPWGWDRDCALGFFPVALYLQRLRYSFPPGIGRALLVECFMTCFRGSASLVAQAVKCLPTMWDAWVRSLGREDPLEKEMATNSSIHAWKMPWTKETAGLQPMGSQRVGHD